MNKSGFLNINKPKNITSHDLVDIVRKELGTKKVGHTGTLDPFAEGVMVLAVNRGTKFIEFFQNSYKEYHVVAELGIITDTFDVTGVVKEKNEVTSEHTDKLYNVINGFVGYYDQVAPAYSARRYKGKRLYEYARKGKIINLPPKKVHIKRISNIKIENNSFEFDVEVSSGTYIRSLIMDIGYKIGCGAVTKKLVRTSIEKFKLKDSIEYEEISYEKLLNPVNYLDIPEVKVKHGYKIENGIHIYVNNVEKFNHSFSKDKLIKIFNEKNRFIGFAKTEKTSNFLQTLLKNNPESFERVAKLYKIFNQR